MTYGSAGRMSSSRTGRLPDARVPSRCGMLASGTDRTIEGASSRRGLQPSDLPCMGVPLKAQASRDTHNRRVGIVARARQSPPSRRARPRWRSLSPGTNRAIPSLDAEIRAAIIALRSPSACTCGTGIRGHGSRSCWCSRVSRGRSRRSPSRAATCLYSAGRVFGWLVEPFLIFLVLAFPSGRLTARPERAPGRRQRCCSSLSSTCRRCCSSTPTRRRLPGPAATGIARPTPSCWSARSRASWTP